jgi:diguanylate cyclase (GGDEF)-like protein/PAS domain S-box-containing protein
LKGTVQDNTQQFERLELLRLLEASIGQVNDAVLVTDTDLLNGPKILFMNKAFLDKTGYQHEAMLGQSPRMLHSETSRALINSKISASLLNGQPAHLEVMNYDRLGNGYWIELDIVGVKNDKGVCTHYVEVQRDITDKKRSAADIERLAYSDSLTGLPNRRYLKDQITRKLLECVEHPMHAALYFLDIDRFKDINDAYGHQYGDLLLIEISRRLEVFTGEHFMAARIGGDEFVLMRTNFGSDAQFAQQTVLRELELILASLCLPYIINGIENYITLSVGISMFGLDQTSADTLYQQADMAMHQAKANGRNTFCLFDVSMEKAAQDRSSMANELRLAVSRNQLSLHYQPQIDHKLGIIGAEALMRWRHDEHGNVSPALFIPLAEQSGQIIQLGQWLLTQACQDLARWAHLPHMAHLSLSVNISPLEFLSAGFVEKVLQTVHLTGAPIHLLKLEITENVLVNDIQDVETKIAKLRACGIRFSIDDFGTGYSSLGYLKKLSLDQLKIDQSFIMDIDGTPNSEIIARSITSLAHSLVLEVIAEGVETQLHEDFLVSIGCTIFQGYLYSRPTPVSEFESFVLSYSQIR